MVENKMEDIPAASAPQPKKNRILRIVLLASAVCLGMCCLALLYLYRIGFLEYAFYGGLQPAKDLNPIMASAKNLMNDGKYDQAIPIWTEVIEQAPGLDFAYYERAVCSYNLLPKEHSQALYLGKIRSAMDDMDKAISISPRNGDYYAFRHDVINSMADQEDYRINRQAITRIALDNALASIALGYSQEYEYTDRVAVADRTILGQCDESLAETQQMLSQTSPQDSSITGLYRMEGAAYACLGRLDEAVQAMDACHQEPELHR